MLLSSATCNASVILKILIYEKWRTDIWGIMDGGEFRYMGDRNIIAEITTMFEANLYKVAK